MTKPRHKIAVLMWLAGLAVLLLWTWAMFDFAHTYPVRAGNSGGLVTGAVAGAVLIALGTIIELVDRIRWKEPPPEACRESASLWAFVRRWLRSTTE